MGAAFARVRVLPKKDKGDVLRAGILLSPQPASGVGAPAAASWGAGAWAARQRCGARASTPGRRAAVRGRTCAWAFLGHTL